MIKSFDRMNSRAANGFKEMASLTALTMVLTALFSFVQMAGAGSLHAFPANPRGSESGLQTPAVPHGSVSDLQTVVVPHESASNLQTPAVPPGSVSDLQTMASSPENGDSLVTASIITEFDQVQPGQTLLVGVHLDMEQDWYIYWQNPGDSGIPTSIRWNLPDGFETGDLKWPYPTNFYTDSFISHGYKDDVVLMFELSIPGDAADGQTVNLSASVSWLVCRDVCIPGSAEINREMTVTHSAGRSDAEAANADDGHSTDAGVADSVSDSDSATVASLADAGSSDGSGDRELLRKFKARLPQSLPGLHVGFRTQSNSLILDLQHEKLRGADVSELVFYASDEGIVESGAEQHFEITEGGLRITLRKSVFAGGDIRSISGVLYNSSGWDENGTGMKAIYVTSRE